MKKKGLLLYNKNEQPQWNFFSGGWFIPQRVASPKSSALLHFYNHLKIGKYIV